MKKFVLIAAVLIICAVFIIPALFSSTSDSVYITTAKVKTSSLVSDVSYSGVLEAEKNVPVTSDTGGRITNLNVSLGQTVKEGDVLFTVDGTDIALQVNQAEANYKAAEANFDKVAGGAIKQSDLQLSQTLERAENEYSDAGEAYDTAKSQYDTNTAIAAAQSAYDLSKAEYERIKLSVSLGEDSEYSLKIAKNKMDSASSQLELAKSSAKTALNNAKSRLDNAELSLENARENLSLSKSTINPENIKSAKAALDSAKATLDIAKRKLDQTKVKAFSSGVIGTCSIKTGDVISPQVPVMTIINTGNLDMTLHITESGANQVSPGATAEITVMETGEKLTGKITQVSSMSDSTTGLTDVKVSVENPNGKIKAGTLASAVIKPQKENRKIFIPIKSVLSYESNPYVYVLENNKLKKIPVKLGRQKYAYVEALSGITPDIRVVVDGNDKLSENSRFQIVKSIS